MEILSKNWCDCSQLDCEPSPSWQFTSVCIRQQDPELWPEDSKNGTCVQFVNVLLLTLHFLCKCTVIGPSNVCDRSWRFDPRISIWLDFLSRWWELDQECNQTPMKPDALSLISFLPESAAWAWSTWSNQPHRRNWADTFLLSRACGGRLSAVSLFVFVTIILREKRIIFYTWRITYSIAQGRNVVGQAGPAEAITAQTPRWPMMTRCKGSDPSRANYAEH